jgi:hypothetical protein
MPVCTLNLLSLKTSISAFLTDLKANQISPLVIAKVVRWIILPSKISTDPLLARNIHWDLLVITEGQSDLPRSLQGHIKHQWTVRSGVPSRLVKGFAETNHRLLNPRRMDILPLTDSLDNPRIAKSSQSLELSADLLAWMETFLRGKSGNGAVSMLNLLAFKEGKKEEYLKYGKAFAESVGSRRGGVAKIVGNVISCSSSPEGVKEWDEVALAHYPSILHFADMIGSEDYQEANHKYRVDSLEDTFILCTTELDLDDEVRGSKL